MIASLKLAAFSKSSSLLKGRIVFSRHLTRVIILDKLLNIELLDLILLRGIIDRIEYILNMLDNGLRYNAMLFIILLLNVAPSVRLGYGSHHGIRDFIGIQDYAAVTVTRTSSDDLN